MVGMKTGSERIQPVVDAVLAQILLSTDAFRTFMTILKEENPQLRSIVHQYYCK